MSFWEQDGQGAVSRQLRLLDHACSKWLPQQPHEGKGVEGSGGEDQAQDPTSDLPLIGVETSTHSSLTQPYQHALHTLSSGWPFSLKISAMLSKPKGPMLFLPIFHKQNKNQIKRLISVCTELAAGRRCGGR
ncbi:unnamed protein product [Lepidochelys olivacea]